MKKVILFAVISSVILSSCGIAEGNAREPAIGGEHLPLNETRIKEPEKDPGSPIMTPGEDPAEETPEAEKPSMGLSEVALSEIESKYRNEVPEAFGTSIEGIITTIGTKEKVIALTFDACGGGAGFGFDEKLIDFLIEERIPATLFINGQWIEHNMGIFMELAENGLFEIENHGHSHSPLSVEGKKAYGIRGTQSAREVIEEVWQNAEKIQSLTGRWPLFFRSGTAHYDDVALKIVRDLGEIPVNFSVNGDAGATFSADQIVQAAHKAPNGSIFIFHMNHPEKQTAEGIMKLIPLLRNKGYQFILLKDYADLLE